MRHPTTHLRPSALATLALAGFTLAGCGEEAPDVWAGPLSSEGAPPIEAAPPPSVSGSQAGDFEDIGADVELPDPEGGGMIDPQGPLTAPTIGGGVVGAVSWPGELLDKPSGQTAAPAATACTFTVVDLAAGCDADRPAFCAVEDKLMGYFAGGVSVEGPEGRYTFTSAEAFFKAAPPKGDAGPILGDTQDPEADAANPLIVELLLAEANLALSAEGHAGDLPLEGLARVDGPFQGLSASAIVEVSHAIVGGDEALLLGLGLDYDKLTEELATLNAAAEGCEISTDLLR